MKKLKFLFTASRASHIENFHMPAINALRQNGHTVDTATEGYVKENLVDHSYNLIFQKKIYSPRNIGTINQLSKIIKSNSYDVIISNTTLAGIITRLAIPKLKNKPYHIYICHGYLFNDDNSKKAKLYRSIEKSTSSKIDLLLTMNNDDLELARKYVFCKNIQYINGMGIDSNKFPVLSADECNSFRKSLGIKENDFVFLCVAEFSERKNQQLIIKAFSELLKTKPDSVLLFAGNGELLENCKALAEYYEISHKVRFLGYITDTNILYRSAQAIISASHIEGLPFNIMEALECGIPAIVSKIKGHKDLIIDGFNGMLFADNDKIGLSEKMSELSNSEIYNKIKKNVFLESKYEVSEATEVLLHYYLQLSETIPTYSV